MNAAKSKQLSCQYKWKLTGGIFTAAALSNEELFSGYLDGDGNALRILLERHGDALTLYINGYIHDIHDAEDLMIEAFSRMIHARPRLTPNGFRPYLYKTARNLALRYAGKLCRRRDFSLEGLESEAESGILVEKVFQSGERNHILRECMDQLSPDYCEVLYLLYYEGMTYAQAAQVMRKSTKQIDHLAERAKKRLRRMLEREGITDPNY